VEIEEEKPASGFDILEAEGLQERAFPGARLPEQRDVHRTAHLANADLAIRPLFLGHSKTKGRHPVAILPAAANPALQAVPDRDHEMFE
jgi:hypothetical protein